MWKRHFLNEQQTETVVVALQAALVDTIHLALVAKQAHWNLRGHRFQEIHEKLDEVTDHARQYSDAIAERAVMLGRPADGRVATVHNRSHIEPFPPGFHSVEATLSLVCDRLFTTVQHLREARAAVAEADPISEDLLIEACRSLEEHLWMLQASEFGSP